MLLSPLLYYLSTIHPRANSARAERLVALIGLALRAKMGKKPAKSDVAERESKRENGADASPDARSSGRRVAATAATG